MDKILGKTDFQDYSLTDTGKRTLFDELYYKRLDNNEKEYKDEEFQSILDFFFRNFDNTINEALAEGITTNHTPLDRHVRIAMNRRKLEAWFGAVAYCCNRPDLTGEKILDYFCSEYYQSGILKNEFAATINEMTEVLGRNIKLENNNFLSQIESIPQKATGRK